MDDLISRETMKDVIDITTWYHQNRNKDMVEGASVESAAWFKAEDVYKAIENAPTVQPERKRGKWVNDRGLYKCSNCNHVFSELWWVETCPIDRMNKIMRFCPQCGAEMEVEE